MKLNSKIIVFVILVSMLSLMLAGCKGEPKQVLTQMRSRLYKPAHTLVKVMVWAAK